MLKIKQQAMKILLKFFIFAFIIISTNIKSYADNGTIYIFNVTKTLNPDDSEVSTTKHRVPGKSVLCVIEKTRIDIPSIAIEDITSFEIYDTYGNYIASFGNESDFLEYLFTLSGIFELRFQMEGFTIHGTLNCNSSV